MTNFITADKFLRIEETSSDQDWDDFVLSSPEGSIYSTSTFLNACPVRPRQWYCKKGEERKAAIVVFEEGSSGKCVFPPNFIYGGILFAPDQAKQPPDRIHDQFFSAKALIDHLEHNFSDICLTTSPDFSDLRPFLWHNYGNESHTPKIEVRYTSRLDLVGFADPETMLTTMGASRRRSIRRGLAENLVVEEFFDLSRFESFYLQTFKRQGIDVPSDEVAFMRNVLPELKHKGLIEMFVVMDLDGQPANIGVFSLFGSTVTYLFGASKDSAKSAHTGSILFWNVCQIFFKRGFRQLDFDGVNSPKRGYFKLSFGGSLEPYFRIRWKSAFADGQIKSTQT